MMSSALVIHVCFHDGRYHGDGDWPPCPARLLQALVAAAGMNGNLDDARSALRWLEELPGSPLVGAPLATRRRQRVTFYMPNNDLDAVGGDPHRVAEIRTAKKFFQPWYFEATTPFLYIWEGAVDEDGAHAKVICSLAERLYQFGRGIDMAWAWAETQDESQLEALLANYPGQILRPSAGTGGTTLACPQRGSLASVERRYQAYRQRFEVKRSGKAVNFTFHQAPRPSFRPVAYESPPSRNLYELRVPSSAASFAPWALAEINTLVIRLRDAAVARLETALPARRSEIERVLVGRKPDGTNGGPTAERVRIVPLPSIGHPHADRAIRRVLVEVPAGCPLRAEDVYWAFSGLEPVDADTGELYPIVVTPAADVGMLRHYGIDEEIKARTWRTVTPAALPEAAARRRIEPTRMLAEAKGGAERCQEQQHAAAAVVQALRHAEVRARAESIQVQREPFESNGQRVEAFATGTRFRKERLWHVEVTFASPVVGPLLIGDGRFMGLGLMVPLRGDPRTSPESGPTGEPSAQAVSTIDDRGGSRDS